MKPQLFFNRVTLSHKFNLNLQSLKKNTRPGAEIGRQACLRGMCPYGRAGSSPAPGTKAFLLESLLFYPFQSFTKIFFIILKPSQNQTRFNAFYVAKKISLNNKDKIVILFYSFYKILCHKTYIFDLFFKEKKHIIALGFATVQ